MGQLLEILLPVFGLIALGYVAVVTGWLKQQTGDELAAYVFNVAVPVLLMRSMITSEFSDTSPWRYFSAYYLGVACVWLFAALIAIYGFKRDYRASVIAGISAGFSNLVLLGIPLIQQAFGGPGLAIHLMLVSINLPLMLFVTTLLMEISVRADGVEKTHLSLSAIVFRLLGNLAKNPIVLGIAIGLTWRFLSVPFYKPIADLTDLIARTAGPVALFSLGASLNKYGLKGNLGPAAIIAVIAVIAMPFAIYSLANFVFQLPVLWVQVAVLAAACPSGVNAYLLATHFKTAEGLASNSIVLSTLFGIVTLPLWLQFMVRL